MRSKNIILCIKPAKKARRLLLPKLKKYPKQTPDDALVYSTQRRGRTLGNPALEHATHGVAAALIVVARARIDDRGADVETRGAHGRAERRRPVVAARRLAVQAVSRVEVA